MQLNQEGSSTLFNLFFVMALATLCLVFLSKHLEQTKSLKAKQEIILCGKQYLELTKSFYRKIEELNKIILVADRTQDAAMIITVAFPGFATLSASANKIKKAAQTMQQVNNVSFMKNLISIRRGRCSFPLKWDIHPYKLKGIALKRKSTGEAEVRNKKWKINIKNKSYLITLKFRARRDRLRASFYKIRKSRLMDSLLLNLPFSQRL